MDFYLFPAEPVAEPVELVTVSVHHFFVPYRLVWSSWFDWWAARDAECC